ncbi:hypothetical protein DFH06DRAFT_1166277 [Mycena polygramma]|nr:hypothetical protein DFH06DRAFT_1166277 [Mycena polygramma]
MRTSIFQSLGFTALVAAVLVPLALGVPVANTVLTPGGLSDRTKITAVPPGGRVEHVGKDIHVLSANGTVVHVSTRQERHPQPRRPLGHFGQLGSRGRRGPT